MYTNPEQTGTMTKQSKGGLSVLIRAKSHGCQMGSNDPQNLWQSHL